MSSPSLRAVLAFTADNLRCALQNAPASTVCLTADDLASISHGKAVSLSIPDPLHLGCSIRLCLVPPAAPSLPPSVPYMFGPDAARAMGGE
ncbi:hypothetical protein CRT60_00260 [Azospirillum palustre]|uniref:Uncharacterized protein n=1 Tax=Azospirillum palustre TaxID=2044885 RepID=A0A2B8BNX1_9PROT|nr:hypothetical protein CRT60_00260 [Azospirillum palustre]